VNNPNALPLGPRRTSAAPRALHRRFGTHHPSRVRNFAGVGPALLQPVTHAVRPNTRLSKVAWCPDVPELLASGGANGGWLHYVRPSGAADSWPLPCSPGAGGWTGLADLEWLPGRRRALVGSSASNGVLLWDSGEGGGADCLAALPGGDLVMGGCGSGKVGDQGRCCPLCHAYCGRGALSHTPAGAPGCV
jgi:hypothetical protein